MTHDSTPLPPDPPRTFRLGAAPEEPSSSSRSLARTLRDWYVALRAEGFTEREALDLIGQLLTAQAKRDD